MMQHSGRYKVKRTLVLFQLLHAWVHSNTYFLWFAFSISHSYAYCAEYTCEIYYSSKITKYRV